MTYIIQFNSIRLFNFGFFLNVKLYFDKPTAIAQLENQIRTEIDEFEHFSDRMETDRRPWGGYLK